MNKKSSLALFSLFTLIFFSSMGFADTAFVTNNILTTIKGQAVPEAQIEAMAYFVPKYKRTQGPLDEKAVAACRFEEDFYNVNGNELARNISVTRGTEGSYNFQVGAGGMRGACEYVLASVYLFLEDKELFESFNMRTDLDVNYFNAITEGEIDPQTTEKLEPQETLYCDFSKAAEIGATCRLNEDLLIWDLQIHATGEIFTLDLKDEKFAPAPTNSETLP